MERIVSEINKVSFYDYRANTASEGEVMQFAKRVKEAFNYELEMSYLNFLTCINGFELNGLNFYGTHAKPEMYVLGAIEQNAFWKSEIPSLGIYYLIGDGDMDFYCFDAKRKTYHALMKSTSTPIDIFPSFEGLIKCLVGIYTYNSGFK